MPAVLVWKKSRSVYIVLHIVLVWKLIICLIICSVSLNSAVKYYCL
jgi:hypothetical protein